MATTTIYVTASNHDAWQGAGGTDITSASLQIDSASRFGGFYFAAGAIPQGSTINTATFSYSPSSTLYDDSNCRWYAQAADTAAVFDSGDATNISDRTLTTNYTVDNTSGLGRNYVDITVTAAVQEVVSRAGWTGPIVIIGDGQATIDFRIESYDASSIYPAKLYIDYTEPPTGGLLLVSHHYRIEMGA